MALQIEGTAWVFGDDINTDLILPGAAFLLPVKEQIKYCFSANRPGWSDKVQSGDIVVAGTNFGLGSARPIGNVFMFIVSTPLGWIVAGMGDPSIPVWGLISAAIAKSWVIKIKPIFLSSLSSPNNSKILA